ncbi:MAG: DEAD/DEAH box helicase family protein, partial [Alphaproteobacteria bacterium]
MNLTDIKLLRRGISEKLKSESEREKLRGKQVDAFDALVSDKFTDEQISHSYFKLPTGFGKTVMFAHMADAYFSAVESAGAKRQKII